ncbi:ubiquinone biosynthesis methyltransferase UbiE [Bifidobacterium margollesii]|uniref:Demethylmenaquinone methyltransferase n=1 Tax=Bifidobacterium margollesii TaxID=2020964 RepID=A0A2N5J805_9BIFI|nr:ubiquinone/menaquinone biosynthesis methyltransferase [Bifidobacterium margollesii]PLS30344.1 ubiquinone biosynthesis methyltransferase UbiE [Bifidobacterium margollesii]
MFDAIASSYEMVDDLASLGQCRLWARAVANALEGLCAEDRAGLAGTRVLDVACGTGVSSRALAARGAEVTGCDISEGMLAVARRRRNPVRRDGIRYVTADAECRLPFPDEWFDAVSVSYGLRNMGDPEAALRHMLRVVRPGSPIVVLDFDMPDDPVLRTLYRAYSSVALPALGGLLTGQTEPYRYLNRSIGEWEGRRGVARMMLAAGWRDVRTATLCGGIASICTARRAALTMR